MSQSFSSIESEGSGSTTNLTVKDPEANDQILNDPDILYTKYLQMCMERKLTKRKLNKTLMDLDANLCHALKQHSKLILECENTRNCVAELKNKEVENKITNAMEAVFTTPEAENFIELDEALEVSLIKLESRANDLVLKNVSFSLEEQEEFANYLRNIIRNLNVLKDYFERIHLDKSEKFRSDVLEKSKHFMESYEKFLSSLKTIEALLIVSSGLDIDKSKLMKENSL